MCRNPLRPRPKSTNAAWMDGLDVGDAALVDVPDVGGGAGSLHVKFFELSVFQEGDSAFFALGDVDQHFLCHAIMSVVSCQWSVAQ